jgi:hypothetical protein
MYLSDFTNHGRNRKFSTVSVGLLGFNAMCTCRKILTFRKNILPSSSGLNVTGYELGNRVLFLAKAFTVLFIMTLGPPNLLLSECRKNIPSE